MSGDRFATHQRKSQLDALAFGLLLLCCGFWGVQQVLIKLTVAEVPPLWQASLRFWIATALLWLWCLWRGVALWVRDGSGRAGLLAGLLFGGEFACIYLGMTHTSASRLTVFLYTSPFVVALLVPLVVPSEALRRVQWAGLLLAFASVVLAFSEGFFSPDALPGQWRGDLLALAAGLLWGLTTLVIRSSRLSSASAEKTLFYQVAVTSLLTPLLSLGLGERWSLDLSPAAWGSIGVQASVGAFASYLTWMWLLRHYPATQVASFSFLTPVFALLLGVWWLGEPLTWQLLVALLGVALGMLLVGRRAPPAPPKG